MSQVLQGCHRCGGHPQHPTVSLQVYKIFRCNQCETLTCNTHLIGLSGNTCPKCNSTSVTCLATRDTRVKAKEAKSKDTVIHPKRQGNDGNSQGVGGFGAGRAAPQIKSAANIGGATFKPQTPLAVLTGKSLASDFVDSMTGGGLDKLKAHQITATVELHEEHHHNHDHKHEGGKMLSAAEEQQGESEKPLSLSSPLGMQANISASEAKDSKAAEEAAPLAAPEDLPDPASIRSGTTIYADACFRPTTDDKLHTLSQLLENIESQLEGGKNLKVLTLALDFYDVKKYQPQIQGFLQKYPFVRLAVGYGPRHAADEDLDFEGLQQFINITPHVIALDTGLDLHFAAYSKDAQVKLLQKQIEMANHLGKPIFLSAVKADDVLLEAIHVPIKGVYAAPLKSDAAVEVCKKHNLWVCARSEITHQAHDDYRQRLAKIPTGKVLLGTGSELIAPAGQKAMGNSPLYIDDVARVLMQLYRYQKLETLYAQCYKNLYGLLMGL